MSKAFTREADDAEELPLPVYQAAIPPGGKNYVTQDGARKLEKELEHLTKVERPELAALDDQPDARPKLQAIDKRIRYLRQALASAMVVEPAPQPWEQVRFGATVTVRDQQGETSRYRIVGIDEADVDRDWVSWCSPLARALLNARVGERVRFRPPAGEQELEILAFSYA